MYVITIANFRRQSKVVPEQKVWWLYFIATWNGKKFNLKNKKNNSCSTFLL